MMIRSSKRFSMALLLGIISLPLFGQQWSNPILISSGDTPDMDIDPNSGNVYILSMTNGVTLTKVSPSGAIMSQEKVPGAENDQGEWHFGASVAVDMNGYPHVCYRVYEGDDPDGAPTFSVYYIKKTATGWQNKIRLSQNVRRGYMVRIDVDRNNIAHVVQGFIFDEEGSIHGRVKYFRIKNNAIDKQHELGSNLPYVYRADDRIEITTRSPNEIHIVSGIPDPNGKVYYFYSMDGGNTFTTWGDIHSAQCFGRNGSPDVAVDSTGYVHICYGASEDESRNGQPSVRYVKFLKNSKLVDKAATPAGYLVDWKIGMGLGSIAASDDGQTLLLAFSEQPGGKLYTILSHDSGAVWQSPVEIVSKSGSAEGRNKHLVRSFGQKFYLVYPSNYNVYLRILTIPTNQSPIANAGGPYVGNEGDQIQFSASQSYDPDGMIVKYEWDWQNDGSYDTTTTSSICRYVYEDDFSGQAKLRVTDNGGKSATSLATVTIHNVSPKANAGGPYQGMPRETVILKGSATDPGKRDILTYEWDLDADGIFEIIGQTVPVSYPKGGIYLAVLKVTDDDKGYGLDTAKVQIISQPPVVSPIPSQTVAEGTPFQKIRLDDYVTDPDDADADIFWQVEGAKNLSVSIDANRVATIVPLDENWFGSETLLFIAMDPSQLKDSTSATFTVTNVNDPPQIAPIKDQVTDEGKDFAPIHLDNHVSDPDHNVAELKWQYLNAMNLSCEITNRILYVRPRDPEWSGQERLTLIVTDPSGLSDTTTILFIVHPINDPPVASKIPDQVKYVGEAFEPISLDSFVVDVDHRDEELRWSYADNKNLSVKISNRIASIARTDTNWVGSETIQFIVTDPLGASDTTSATFTSKARNHPPVVTPIPDQQILEGQSFLPIHLDAYVNDPDHRDDQITWIVTGNKELILRVENRIATVLVPNPDWNGSEIIKFKAVDPTGLADSCLTLFRVFPVNDPPVLAAFPDFQIFEDDTLIWSYSYLRSRVTDPDNDSTDYQFQIKNNVMLKWRAEDAKGRIIIFGPPNWHGQETITVQVFDGAGGSDTKPCKITVLSVPDNPEPFTIIKPNGVVISASEDSILFLWHKSHDPEGGRPMYQLSIADGITFGHVIDQYNYILDTSFVYVPKLPLQSGKYYWRVVAFNGVGSTASNIGSFEVSTTSVDADNFSKLPKDYALFQNFPNPFNPETRIIYQLPEKTFIILEIFNSLGQRVAILEEGMKEAGVHTAIWSPHHGMGQRIPSGVYICRLKAGGRLFERKMLLLQ
ncbi:MAG: PKD domain-containing protein [candidate division KSB1 bacterium]|nr:PKD domain-containing protein [candidate division KSB1 bacterium]